ncbi:putative isochorismatase family hydrolase [Naematelia encephala]|uniref:Putative isochorismatase family hydrolase n=1 Tax=Naematelia encephala TaxID=71784 RepID=A0A1Y2BKL2_9TREE|nr:putative isochorismatase family hydrolase [Naematelia encephala]
MTSEGKTALLMIDVQEGFLDRSYWGPSRSNPRFEVNARALLGAYRNLESRSPSLHKLIHVNHASHNPSSPLHPSAPGFAFQAFARPNPGEIVITKNVNSAFIGTNLEQVLRDHFGFEGGRLYLAGLTTDHCVSTTTRMAGNLKVTGKDGVVVFVEDATAAWKKDEKSHFDAETVHAVNAESLQEFSTVTRTHEVLADWERWAPR